MPRRSTTRPAAPRRVALIYDATRAYDRKVMSGVAAWLREGAAWSIYVEENALKDQRLPALSTWRGDGIIANFDDPHVVEAVLAAKLPTVAFGSGYGWYDPSLGIPYVFTNNRAIARAAAAHFVDRGFRAFAYYGGVLTRTNGWSVEREQAFVKAVARGGSPCLVYRDHRIRGGQYSEALDRTLVRWLRALPKPVALMADNDQRARLALEACRAAAIEVPREVAVIGVDNDELLCQLSTPLLSSVEQGSAHVGAQAAEWLDRIMAGGKSRRSRLVVDPLGVVARGSTDILAVEDPAVALALRFVWEHACDGIQTADVAQAAAISRSGLDARFRNALGRTVRSAIRETQLERVRRWIADTPLSLKEIAARAGFKSVQHMTTLFAARFGTSPARYRRQPGRA